MGIIATLIIGAIAGWLGGTIYKGSGLGLFGNIIVGLLGSGVGYWLLGSVFNLSWWRMDCFHLDRSYRGYCYLVRNNLDS